LRVSSTNSVQRQTVNVVNGSSVNSVASGVIGATVSGGGSIWSSGGNQPNTVTSEFGTIGGGLGNTASGAVSTISGGGSNSAAERYSTVSGGYKNSALGDFGTVAGGYENLVTGYLGVVGGGTANRAGGAQTTIGGGAYNQTSGEFSAIVGGGDNIATGNNSVVLGGFRNLASGNESIAAGYWARATHNQSAVIGQNPNGPTESSGVATFTTHFQNGYFLFGGTSAVGGVKSCKYVPDVSNGWVCSSDKNLKSKIQNLNSQVVLGKLMTLPISSWSFKGGERYRQIGPMAQDFFSAFRLGDDDKHISPMNMSGVALAAIQGLNQKLETEKAKNKAKEAEIAGLKADLALIKKKLGL
jgi:trimeric autotransporter adhesin